MILMKTVMVVLALAGVKLTLVWYITLEQKVCPAVSNIFSILV